MRYYKCIVPVINLMFYTSVQFLQSDIRHDEKRSLPSAKPNPHVVNVKVQEEDEAYFMQFLAPDSVNRVEYRLCSHPPNPPNGSSASLASFLPSKVRTLNFRTATCFSWSKVACISTMLSMSIGAGGDWCGSKQPLIVMHVGVLVSTTK